MHADPAISKVTPAYKNLYFGLQIHDKAAFYSMVSTGIVHKGVVLGADRRVDERKSMRYLSKALRIIHDKLSHPVEGISVGVITTIIVFLTYDVR